MDFYKLRHSLLCPHYHLPPLQVSSREFEECMGLWSTSSLGNTPPRDSASLNQSRWNPKSSLCLSLIPSGNVYWHGGLGEISKRILHSQVHSPVEAETDPWKKFINLQVLWWNSAEYIIGRRERGFPSWGSREMAQSWGDAWAAVECCWVGACEMDWGQGGGAEEEILQEKQRSKALAFTAGYTLESSGETSKTCSCLDLTSEQLN